MNRRHFAEALKAFEYGYWTALLQMHRWKVSAAADFAGMNRCHVYRKLKSLGITHSQQQARHQ